MRQAIVLLFVAFSASAVRAQEKPSAPPPKNDRLIALLTELNGAKNSKDRDAVLHRASTDVTLDQETDAFVQKARKDLPGVTCVCIENWVKDKRFLEARGALVLVEAFVEADAKALTGSDTYFGCSYLFKESEQLGDWWSASGDPIRALHHYEAALARLRRLNHLAVAQGWLKEYEAGLKRIRDKIAEVRKDSRK